MISLHRKRIFIFVSLGKMIVISKRYGMWEMIKFFIIINLFYVCAFRASANPIIAEEVLQNKLLTFRKNTVVTNMPVQVAGSSCAIQKQPVGALQKIIISKKRRWLVFDKVYVKDQKVALFLRPYEKVNQIHTIILTCNKFENLMQIRVFETVKN